MLYNPPTGGGANDPYVGKDVAAGTQGSKVPPGALEFPQRELVNLIAAAGETPTNADLQQVLRAIRSGILEYSVDSGSADAMVITPNPAVTAITDGMKFCVGKGSSPNATTSPTLSVNGIVQTIFKSDGSTLAIGDLPGNCRFTVRSDGTKLRLEGGLVKSDVPAPPAPPTVPTPVLHIGADTSGSAAAVLATVYPPITSYQDGHVYVIDAAHACPGGTVNANLCGLGNRPIVRNDYSALQAGDWQQYARLVLIDNGASLMLADFTGPQIQALAGSSAAVLNYVDKSTPRGSTKLTAFSPGLILSDISSDTYSITQTSGAFRGATYIDVSATCAIRDLAGDGAEGGGTARVGLIDETNGGTTTFSNYVGGGAYTTNTQVPLVVPRVIFNIDPTHTYHLVIALQKGGSDGQVQSYDAYIFGQHDGINL